MEPTTGLEPVNLFLTKEVLYLLSYVGSIGPEPLFILRVILHSVERETGLEPATLSLEG